MDKIWARFRYTSRWEESVSEGWAAVVLERVPTSAPAEPPRAVARITYWDAEGQFSLETLGTDVKLHVIEALILEARAKIKGF